MCLMDMCVIVQGCDARLGCTLLLRGSNQETLIALKPILYNAVCPVGVGAGGLLCVLLVLEVCFVVCDQLIMM